MDSATNKPIGRGTSRNSRKKRIEARRNSIESHSKEIQPKGIYTKYYQQKITTKLENVEKHRVPDIFKFLFKAF